MAGTDEEAGSTGETISNGFQDLVRSQGDAVLIHTQVCVEWKVEHENCKGCPSELGCSKAVSLMLVSMTPILYKPTSYEDHERMQQSIHDKMDKILAAKTEEELKAVRM